MSSLPLVVATILISQAADGEPRWLKLDPKEAGFSISFPTLPKQGTQKGRNAKGETEVFFLQAEREGLIFRVEKGAVGETISSRDDEEKYFKGYRVFMEGQATVKEETRLELSGYPGREWVLERPFRAKSAPSTFVFRSYLVNDTLYQIRLFATRPGQVPPPEIREKFFGSFKLTGVKPRPAEPAKDETEKAGTPKS